MTVPRLPLALVLWAAVAWSQGVDSIVRRIQELAPQEPVALGIESELRARPCSGKHIRICRPRL